MPPTTPKLTPKDFFLQLGIIVSLYVSVISLINLLFQTIDYAFPDQLAYYGDPYSGGIRVAIASLIIIFPLYILLSWFVERLFKTVPEKRELGVRRWLMYFTLFIAGIVVIVDLVSLINAFLGGELTTRFAFKTLSVLLIAGGVFGYYLYDLRRVVGTPSKNKIWSVSAIVVVLLSMIWGFSIMGSPMSAREKRFDDTRVSGLQNIQWQIVNYWQQKGKLPGDLAALNDSISGFVAPVDPETKQPYSYKLTDTKNFELCANFNLPSSINGPTGRTIAQPVGMGLEGDSWTHAQGQGCFKRTIDAELYPVKPKNPAI